MSQKCTRFRRLMIESLEARSLLAGNLSVSVTDGVLAITGDAANNRFHIEKLPAASSTGGWSGARFKLSQPWVPKGEMPTKINGQTSLIVEGVKAGLQMNLGDGVDIVYVFGTRGLHSPAGIPGMVNIDMGPGNDRLDLQIKNHDTVNVQMGKGSDFLLLRAQDPLNTTTLLGDPDFSSGDPAGDDTMRIYLQAAGPTIVNGAYGNDRIRIDGRTTTSRATLHFKGEQGDDSLSLVIVGELQAGFRIDGGDGNDHVEQTLGTVTGDAIINVGRGADTVVLKDLKLSGSLTVWAGMGDDLVTLTWGINCQSTSLGGGDGTDTLEMGKYVSRELGDKHIFGFEVFRDL